MWPLFFPGLSILTYGVLPYAMIVGVASTFETVGHVQQSVRRITKLTLKEFQDVSDVSNTSPNVRIWLFLKTAIICFASCCSLILIHLTVDFRVVAVFWLSVFSSVTVSHQSPKS